MKRLRPDRNVDSITNSQSSISVDFKNSSSDDTVEERVTFDVSVNNGFIFNDDHYIPEEILVNILFCHVDYKTLLSCQLVCKQWNLLMKKYNVWRKKAELMQGTLLLDGNVSSTSYYYICHKKPFNRNLIKNHSGQNVFNADHEWDAKQFPKCTIKSCEKKRHFLIRKDVDCDWTITSNGGNGWAVEAPPQGIASLPDDSVFDGNNCCFVTSYGKCWKQQVIDLVEEGISTYILDDWQPTIRVSEWFTSHEKYDSVYACTIELLSSEDDVLRHFNHSRVMKSEEKNQWFKYEHEFKNYGKGLRKIEFGHGGQNLRFRTGHFGSKMAGVCIKLEVPDILPLVLDPQEKPIVPAPYYPSDDDVDHSDFADSASD